MSREIAWVSEKRWGPGRRYRLLSEVATAECTRMVEVRPAEYTGTSNSGPTITIPPDSETEPDAGVPTEESK